MSIPLFYSGILLNFLHFSLGPPLFDFSRRPNIITRVACYKFFPLILIVKPPLYRCQSLSFFLRGDVPNNLNYSGQRGSFALQRKRRIQYKSTYKTSLSSPLHTQSAHPSFPQTSVVANQSFYNIKMLFFLNSAPAKSIEVNRHIAVIIHCLLII
jgi:hypothetical protein